MRLSSGYETKKARVEMLPLIDVVFLLLVFFVYAMLSMVLHRGLKVDLPAASSTHLEKSDYVSITLTADNEILLGEHPIAFDRLADGVLGRLGGTGAVLPVFIEGDRRADLGLAVEILDELRRVGIERVSFSCKERKEHSQ